MTEANNKDFSTYRERDKAAEALMSMEGWITGKKIEKLGISIFIFEGNYADLMKQIEIFEQPTSILLQDVRNRSELHEFFKEVTRLLHNYVSAAFTLVDHTRNLSDELYGEERFAEFKSEYGIRTTKDFAENPLHRFVQGLRNYCIHKELPVVGSTLKFDQIKADLIIDFSNLKENFDWHKFAKEYIDSKDHEENLKTIAVDYYNLVSDFHNWFYRRQLEVHKKELDEANALRERIHNSRWTPKM